MLAPNAGLDERGLGAVLSAASCGIGMLDTEVRRPPLEMVGTASELEPCGNADGRAWCCGAISPISVAESRGSASCSIAPSPAPAGPGRE